MSKQKFKSMWEVMKENQFEIPHDINSEFICTICKGLLIDACNAPCGCRYCRQCISEHLKGECKQCPGTSESCKDEEINIDCDIQVDQVINNRISKLIVKCPNDFCQTRVDIKSMENHLKTCERNAPCPFTNIGCGEDKLSNDKLNKHLSSEIHSHTTLLMEWVNISRNETELLKQDINELRSENEKRTTETALQMQKLSDEICGLKNENIQLKEKLEDLQIRCSDQVSPLELTTQTEEQGKLIGQFERQCQSRKTQLDDKLESQLNKNRELEKKIDEILQANAALGLNLNRQISIHAQLINESLEFVWKINNWSETRRNSQSDSINYVYSQPFFSHKNGYKMELSLYPDGNGERKGTHLSIFFGLMRGPNDDFLQWPFKHEVSFSLMNQQTGLSHVTEVLSYPDDPSLREALNKPKNGVNSVKCGYQNFIELSEITNNPDLHKHNQLVIKCLVYRYSYQQ